MRFSLLNAKNAAFLLLTASCAHSTSNSGAAVKADQSSNTLVYQCTCAEQNQDNCSVGFKLELTGGTQAKVTKETHVHNGSLVDDEGDFSRFSGFGPIWDLTYATDLLISKAALAGDSSAQVQAMDSHGDPRQTSFACTLQ